MPVGPEGAGRDASRAWYCEVDAYRGNTGGVTGHFTQVSPYDDCIKKEMMHTFYSIGDFEPYLISCILETQLISSNCQMKTTAKLYLH